MKNIININSNNIRLDITKKFIEGDINCIFVDIMNEKFSTENSNFMELIFNNININKTDIIIINCSNINYMNINVLNDLVNELKNIKDKNIKIKFIELKNKFLLLFDILRFNKIFKNVIYNKIKIINNEIKCNDYNIKYIKNKIIIKFINYNNKSIHDIMNEIYIFIIMQHKYDEILFDLINIKNIELKFINILLYINNILEKYNKELILTNIHRNNLKQLNICQIINMFNIDNIL